MKEERSKLKELADYIMRCDTLEQMLILFDRKNYKL